MDLTKIATNYRILPIRTGKYWVNKKILLTINAAYEKIKKILSVRRENKI